MSIQLTGADIVDLAVQTETRGEAFYRQAAQEATWPEAQKLFTYLADQEVRHKQIFQGLGGAIVMTEVSPETWEEALGYIQATVDRAFFAKEDAPIRAVPRGATVPEMLKQAIAFEKETLLFFYGVLDLVQPANKHLVEQIIAEEKSHVRQLAAMLAQAKA